MGGYIEGSTALEIAVPLVQCSGICKEWLSPDEMVSIAGQPVCPDCLRDYLQTDAVAHDYTAGFLAAYEGEFLEWLFQGEVYLPGKLFQDNPFLSAKDKLRWLRLGWEDWKKSHPQDAAEAQREFIEASSDEWEAYLRGC